MIMRWPRAYGDIAAQSRYPDESRGGQGGLPAAG